MQNNGKAYKAGDNSSTKCKTIDGKRYAFDEDCKMLYGWASATTERITDEDGWATEEGVYYLGNGDDGAMKTGSTTVTLDGDTNSFLFSKSGGAEGKGRGLTGIDDNKYIYKYGMKIKASTDDKHRVVKVTGTSKDTGSNDVTVIKISSADLRKGGIVGNIETPKNKDKEKELVMYINNKNLKKAGFSDWDSWE